MNVKTILYSIGILILGLVVGGFVTYKYTNDRIEKAEKKIINSQRIIDSVQSANKEQKRLFDKEITKQNITIDYYRNRIKTRENDFKNDTIIPSDDELIQRVRILTGNNH